MATATASLYRRNFRRSSFTFAQRFFLTQQPTELVHKCQLPSFKETRPSDVHFVRMATTSSITSEGLAATARGGSDSTAEAGRVGAGGPTAEPVDERLKVLEAALDHVPRLGWSTEALVEGSRDAGLSPAFVGVFSRGESELVEYFMSVCRAKLLERALEKRSEVEVIPQQQRIKEVLRERLELQGRFSSSWSQALSIQVRPQNLPHSLRQRMELGDALWVASGGQGSGVEVYIQKGLLGMAYQEAELFMLTDFSPGFDNTWTFLERRLEGTERMKINVQETAQMAISFGTKLATTLARIIQARPPVRS